MAQLTLRYAVHQTMISAVKADAHLAWLARRLLSVLGVGPMVAVRMQATLSELHGRSPEAIASLAGLAPHADDSGGRHGRRAVSGGRWRVSEALYMAALAAARGTTHLADF